MRRWAGAFSVMSVVWLAPSARAETQGLLSEERGVVILQNGNSADADFLWDRFAVEPVVTQSQKTKSFETSAGDFKAVCGRAEHGARTLTTCMLTFERVGPRGSLTIDKEGGRLSGGYWEDVAGAFALPQGLSTSPDGRLSFCFACGAGAFPISIAWTR